MVLYPNNLHLVEIDYWDYTFDGAGVPIVGRAGAKPAAGEGQTHPLLLFDPEVAGGPWINHYEIGVLDPSFLDGGPKFGALLYGALALVELVHCYPRLHPGNMLVGL